MFPKNFHLLLWIIVSVQLKSAVCFFVKQWYGYRNSGGRCIKDTAQIQSNGSWGNLSFLTTTYNCLEPAAQFRFRHNGAMLNLKRQGCLAAFNKSGSGENLVMFYVYVDSVSLDTAACVQKPDEGIYRAITHNPQGKLSIYYKGKDIKSSFETWCANIVHLRHFTLFERYRIHNIVNLTRRCHSPVTRLVFGSVTCHYDKVKNANCPKNQYMVVKFASYRGLLAPRKCGLSDDYSCEVDVTCLVKKQCDGLRECSITVNDNLFSADQCRGLSNYLHFEYQCVDTVNPYKKPCVRDVSLFYSLSPYEGIVQITMTDKRTKTLCWGSVNSYTKSVICHQLGYDRTYSFVNVSVPADIKAETFSGSINCKGEEKYLSQCSITVTASKNCPKLSYIKCHSGRREKYEPLLEDKQRFPDSSFSASASSEGHSAADARISSGSSWCAPVSVQKSYLQVDLGRVYRVYHLITYGDSTSRKWVASYKLSYTTDFIKWKYQSRKGNKNAYNRAATVQYLRVTARALRFIPQTYVGQSCMRVDIWGESLVRDKPTNLTVANITSRSAEISWTYPENHGKYGLRKFLIKRWKDDSQYPRTSYANKVNKYKIKNLTPNSRYKISVAAGNNMGYSEGTITTFLTKEEAPSGPPLDIKTTTKSTSSLSFIWNPPQKTKRNGVIISYTACISYSRYGSCFQKFVTNQREWLVRNLNASTKYYFRVLASTRIGNGQYSASIGYFTNGPPSGPPLNINTRSKSASSLFFVWDPPEKAKQNGVIISYTACVSHSENGLCFQTFVTIASRRQWFVGNFNALTKYYIRVLASTKAGHGNFSESKGFFTNGRAVEKPIAATLDTLTFLLKNPTTEFLYFYVVALKLKDGKEPASPDNYKNNELVTYAQAETSTELKPYIAAIVPSSGINGNMSFTLGDSSNTNEPALRKLGSTTSDYYNSPLEPGNSYRIFQRIIINEKGDYYSTDWSPASRTSENPGTDKNERSGKNLAGIVVLAILLVLSFGIIAYLVYHIRRLKSSGCSKSTGTNLEKTSGGNNSQVIRYQRGGDDVDIYENVENDSTYTALKRPEERESNVHLYCNPNEM